ncbi:hypothetical protein TSUD_253420 [Trifolium subterraneum]|nr:hypothetical protein TSUD_253420 [Trifolium subterraneum]
MPTDSESTTLFARSRLATLTAHLLPFNNQPADHLLPHHLSAQSPAANLNGTLTIVDERTGKKYQVEVSQDGTVKATDFKKISTGKNDKGLKLYDPGYLNTAPVRSTISYIDGDEGILRYRGYPIEELAEKSTFMEVSYLIMYGSLPTERQLAEWNFAISQHSAVPEGVLDIIQSMPHDAHPMGVLVNSISALSVFHPDANPALRGLDIYNSKEVRDKQIARIIGKVWKRKLSGFGHRVYKNYDPRAKVLKNLTEEVFSIVGRDPLIEVAVALEKVALSDEYFIKRKLYPNVDFYSGLIYRAMGFPPEYFTVLFAIPRMAGYLSHWRESLDDPDTKIMRPQQVYIGEWLRHYTPIKQRTASSDADKLGQVTISNASKRRLAGSRI